MEKCNHIERPGIEYLHAQAMNYVVYSPYRSANLGPGLKGGLGPSIFPTLMPNKARLKLSKYLFGICFDDQEVIP